MLPALSGTLLALEYGLHIYTYIHTYIHIYIVRTRGQQQFTSTLHPTNTMAQVQLMYI